ncbi:MAG: type I-F CRISPR-associated helicase Cas3, partial [Chlamydiia bacterium]|nr:type I-F CRISPR-associated helicase Cas3 [Chlamydiia bacterium]
MNVLIVSQCSKNASKTSRQILDQFAERCGDRTWATSITMEGVNTLRKLLKQSARRNTAVACHWVRGKGRFELMWIVGNASKFNAEGAVPTNTTSQDVLKVGFENDWQTGKSVSLLAQLAALFHDFGKANTLFQRKLKPKFKGKRFEPCRHEWVSLRLFQAFVGDRTDEEWLERLAAVTPGMDVELQVELVSRALREGLEPGTCPFSKWQPGPVGKAVAWLILSHHLLPAFPKKGREGGPKS